MKGEIQQIDGAAATSTGHSFLDDPVTTRLICKWVIAFLPFTQRGALIFNSE
jgi:hypothetical protein